MNEPQPPQTTNKTVAAVAGGVFTTAIVALQTFAPFVPEQYQPILTGFLTLLTALGVYAVPNQPRRV